MKKDATMYCKSTVLSTTRFVTSHKKRNDSYKRHVNFDVLENMAETDNKYDPSEGIIIV